MDSGRDLEHDNEGGFVERLQRNGALVGLRSAPHPFHHLSKLTSTLKCLWKPRVPTPQSHRGLARGRARRRGRFARTGLTQKCELIDEPAEGSGSQIHQGRGSSLASGSAKPLETGSVLVRVVREEVRLAEVDGLHHATATVRSPVSGPEEIHLPSHQMASP